MRRIDSALVARRGRLAAQHRVALEELRADRSPAGSSSSARSSRPLCAKNAIGFVQTIGLDVVVGDARLRASRATVFGTLSGSLTPQSAALLTMMRSVPYFLHERDHARARPSSCCG